MLRKLLVLLAVLLAVSSSVGAGAAPLKILGFEEMSCQVWLQSKDDAEQRKAYVAWARLSQRAQLRQSKSADFCCFERNS